MSSITRPTMSRRQADSASREDANAPDPSEGAYAILRGALAAVAEAQTGDEALDALFALLREQAGLVALALETMQSLTPSYRAYGDRAALAAAYPALDTAALDGERRSYVGTLPCKCVPPMQVTFVLAPDSPATPELLSALLAPLAMRLDQEALAHRAEESENRARQRISEVATIHEIGQAIDRIEPNRLLSLITHRAALLMDAQACSLMLLNPETGTLHIEASHGLPEDAQEQEQQLGEGIAGRVAQTGEPLLILDAAHDPRLEGVTLRPGIGSSMVVPMKSQDGHILGVLSIRRRQPAADFTEEDLKLFSVFASQAALTLTNTRLYADLKRSAAELLKISTLTRALVSTLDLDELLSRVADDICNVVGFERCCLFMRDVHRAIYMPRVWRGYPDSIGRNPVRDGEGAVGAAARGKGMLAFDARESVPPEQERERAYLQRKGFARALGTDAFVAVPILTNQNRCIGVVVADNRGRRDPISKEQKGLLSTFVNQAGIAIDNARLYEELQENYQNIHRLKNYNDIVFQSIGAGIVATDARGQISRWNQIAEETLQQQSVYFKDAALSEVIARMSLPDAERDHLLGMVQRVVETGERMHMHKLMLHPQGRPPMALNLTLSRLMDHNQERAGVVLTFEDVTQEVRLEAEVEKMRRLADIGQLAAKMAHEVRNALSPIKGAAQIIRLELESQGGAMEWPDIIIAEVDGLSRLTSEMLDFARPTPLDPRSLVVPEFLVGALQSLSPFLAESGVNVRWEIAPDLPELRADPVQLGQVVRNIVMNAAQAMSFGGEIIIQTDYDSQTHLLAIRFRDTGVGIAEEEQERIFRPFVTTKTKGTGLGLPIVQKIVDHHGGSVKVESRLGIGTCFSVLLPLNPPREATDLTPEEMPLISAQQAGPFPDN